VRLEDAFLFLSVDLSGPWRADPAAVCAKAIRVGADVIEVRPAAADPDRSAAEVRRIAEVCRRDDALLFVGDDPSLAARAGADGAHLDRSPLTISEARTILDTGGPVGRTARTPEEASLALELGADYLVYEGGCACPGVFAGFRGLTAAPLFAAGLADIEEARAVVQRGVYRLCLAATGSPAETVADRVAGFSRLLGRSV